MASSPISSQKIDVKKVETVSDLIFLGSKITVNGDCSHEIKRHLLLGRKAMTNLYSVLKTRDITWSTKVHIVKAILFLVVMYRCESWTVKEAECHRIGAFELGCWRTLESPLDSKKIKIVLKEINPEYSLEGLMLNEAPILWPPDAKSRLTGKDPDAGKD